MEDNLIHMPLKPSKVSMKIQSGKGRVRAETWMTEMKSTARKESGTANHDQQEIGQNHNLWYHANFSKRASARKGRCAPFFTISLRHS